MAEPPSYGESTSQYPDDDQEIAPPTDSKVPQRFSIREEISISRTQHIAAIVARLVPRVRERAQNGLGKSTLLLLPSGQDCSQNDDLVGFAEDESPILVQLEGQQNILEFWSQTAALEILQQQLIANLSDNMPAISRAEDIASLPDRPAPVMKGSWFRRKQSKTPGADPAAKSVKAPVTIDVQLDEAHFRSETEYGLFETLRRGVVLVVIEVR